MRTSLRYLGLLILLLLLQTGLRAQQAGVQFFEGDWHDLMLAAEKLGKPVFVDCYTDWCAPCKKMDRLTFPDSVLGSFFNHHFLNYKMDMEKGKGKEIRKRYSVNSFPQFLFLTPKGELIYKTTGYKTPPRMLAEAKRTLPQPVTVDDFRTRYQTGERQPEFLLNYLQVLQQADQPFGAVYSEYLDSIRAQGGDLLSDEILTLTYRQVQALEGPEIEHLVAYRDIFESFFGTDAVAIRLLRLAENTAFEAGKQDSEEDWKQLQDRIPSVFPNSVERTTKRLEIVRLRAQSDWAGFGVAAEAYAEMYLLAEDASGRDLAEIDRLVRIYYRHFTDTEDLVKAERWLSHSLAIDVTVPKLILQAEILLKLGKTRKARSAAERAFALASSTGADTSKAKQVLGKTRE